MKKILLILTAMTQLTGCTARNRGDITSFHYDRQGSAMGSALSYDAKLMDDGTVCVTVIKGMKDSSYVCGRETMEDLARIVDTYGLGRLRKHYKPLGKVLDGSSWGLSVTYSSGAEIVSDGYARTPRRLRDAAEAVANYFEQWASVPSADKVEWFFYRHGNGMVKDSGRSYQAHLDSGGITEIILDECFPSEKTIRTEDRRVFTDLARIIKEYRMYEYKGFYEPDTEVTDGSSWSLQADWPDGTGINAHGYVVWPEGSREAFDAVEKYFDFWRGIPVPASKTVTAGEIDAFLEKWSAPKGALTSFRYERCQGGDCEVYYMTSNPEYNFETAYRRTMGSYAGWSYVIPYDGFAEKIAGMVAAGRFSSYPQTSPDREDKNRDRWLVEVEYDSGDRIQVVEYIDDSSLAEAESVRALVTELLDARMERIGKDIRPNEYSKTTYGADGKPLRRIDYTGDGIVRGGEDFTSPVPLDF